MPFCPYSSIQIFHKIFRLLIEIQFFKNSIVLWPEFWSKSVFESRHIQTWWKGLQAMQCRKVPHFDGRWQRKPKLSFWTTVKMPPQSQMEIGQDNTLTLPPIFAEVSLYCWDFSGSGGAPNPNIFFNSFPPYVSRALKQSKKFFLTFDNIFHVYLISGL